jgi:hypothetical protein
MDRPVEPIHGCRICTCAPPLIGVAPIGFGVEVASPPEPSEAPRVCHRWIWPGVCEATG